MFIKVIAQDHTCNWSNQDCAQDRILCTTSLIASSSEEFCQNSDQSFLMVSGSTGLGQGLHYPPVFVSRVLERNTDSHRCANVFTPLGMLVRLGILEQPTR